MIRRMRCGGGVTQLLAAGAVLLVLSGVAAARPRASTVARGVASAAAPAPAKRRVTERADVARFRARVEKAITAPGPDKGFWGILVQDAATGEVLYANHPDNYFAPASNNKLLTTALALATLGPDYRIHTTLETRATVDSSGQLRGDLVLVGRGDANLSNRVFPYLKQVQRDGPPDKVFVELADAIVAGGIKQIDGDIIADDSLFEPERFPDGWTIDDMLWSYGAAVSAIVVNDNTFTLELRPGEHEGDMAGFSVEPWADFYKIENAVRTGAKSSEQKIAVVREPGSRTIHVSGTMPLGADPHKLVIAVEEPAEYAAALLEHLLEARGVRIYGVARARHAADPANTAQAAAATVLAEHISPTLADDVLLVNKISQNLHAELLLRLAAREKAGALTLDDALKFAADFRHTAGIADADVQTEDGSGLSRSDLVTPRAVAQILAYAAKQPWGEVYRSSLPVAGEDGTLSDRMKNTAAADHVFAKTGTLEGASSLSGYAATTRGEHLIFSIFGNHTGMKSADAEAVLDSITVAMVEELGPEPPRKKKGK